MTVKRIVINLDKVQELCEEIQLDLCKVHKPDFTSLIIEIRQAEQEWDSQNFSRSISTLKEIIDKIKNELEEDCLVPSEIDIILEWINNMPTGTIENFGR